ncbi:MAG: hypothetical protein H0V56_00615 [Chthoniobacterales bacterium]|nr:hypothetical protein [Chthoniobacterales bacterium]
MYSVEADTTKRLLVISVAGHASADDVKEVARRVRELVANFAPGFKALTDFRWMESMATSAAPFMAEVMDALAEKQVSTVVRVVPDPRKDIGLNILSKFRYGPETRVVTYETLADALQELAEIA